MDTNVEKKQDSERGMFYAIIGVATLVITLIGATFAYLSATTNSAVNAVTATGATVTLGFCDVSPGLKQNLIPIDPSITNFDKGGFNTSTSTVSTTAASNTYQFVGIDNLDCRDVNGNNICSVYQFTVTNTSATSTQRVYATLNPNVNTFNNLKFALFKGTAALVEASEKGWDVDGSAVTANMNSFTVPEGTISCINEVGTTVSAEQSFKKTLSADDATRKHVIANRGDLVISQTDLVKAKKDAITLEPVEQVLDIGETMTYTIVLWVDEMYSDQDDQGKSFAATVSFTTEDKSGAQSTGVTGVLTVGS